MEVNDQFAIDKVNFTLVPIISSVKLYKDKLLFVPTKEDKKRSERELKSGRILVKRRENGQSGLRKEKDPGRGPLSGRSWPTRP